jgi:hypothetical protein
VLILCPRVPSVDTLQLFYIAPIRYCPEFEKLFRALFFYVIFAARSCILDIGDDDDQLVLSFTMISSPSKARTNSCRSRSILVVSNRCIGSSLPLHSRKSVSALLIVILLFPVLFYFFTSNVPGVVIPVVGGELFNSVAVSESPPATAIISETQKNKHERPKDLSSSSSKTGIIYSHARDDRTGAAFQDMLMAHAYAWKRNLTYHGACISSNHTAPYADQLKELLQATGLNSILKFACPDTKRGGRIVAQKVYYRKDTAIWTAEWRNYIRSRLRPAFVKTGKNNKNTIAIHIRRGDVSPCDKDGDVVKRYLPNQHYLRILDHYAPVITRAGTTMQEQQQSQVVVYSQSKSFESWSDFSSACSQHNCTLRLDTDILEVWRGLLTADTLILSKSSFSLVAGLLSSAAQVVYTPFWHKPLANWTVISRKLKMETLRDLERIKRDNCTLTR